MLESLRKIKIPPFFSPRLEWIIIIILMLLYYGKNIYYALPGDPLDKAKRLIALEIENKSLRRMARNVLEIKSQMIDSATFGDEEFYIFSISRSIFHACIDILESEEGEKFRHHVIIWDMARMLIQDERWSAAFSEYNKRYPPIETPSITENECHNWGNSE